ncbi:hypothetical protein KBC75_05175 [Candidatus Shapirobacteria bacterium]|nr:hypothetical protein [Candidatus Shapirobacteria bacterium]
MKILFLNVYKGAQEDMLKDFLIKKLDNTDMFCLQETEGQFEGMVDIFHEKIIFEMTKPTESKWNFSIKTMINKKYLTKEVVRLWPEENKIGLGLVTKAENLMVGNMHGVAFNPDDKLDTPERLRQSREMIECLGETGQRIVGGDFNIDINTESVRLFEEAGYRNLIKEYEIETTRNRLAWERYPDHIQKYADFVFVSPEVKVKSFEVLDIEVSDHLPMVLEIEG